jgi:hypothetical protein
MRRRSLMRPRSPLALQLAKEGGATGLDCFDLGEAQGRSSEAFGELIAVEVVALGRLDRPKSGGRLCTYRLAQGAVLLGRVPIRREGCVGVASTKVGR